MELHGIDPGSQHDQIQTTGLVTLGGCKLHLTLDFTPTLGQNYILIQNDGNDPVTGTFDGLAEGAIVRLNSLPFHITYKGGDGNDVALVYDDTALSLESVTVSTEFGADVTGLTAMADGGFITSAWSVKSGTYLMPSQFTWV